jgi:hypothetical protein
LCVLIRVALLVPLGGTLLLGTVALDGAFDCCRALCRTAPIAELLGALRARAAHQLGLLAQCLVQTRDKNLVVACSRRVYAAAGAFGEIPLIILVIALELGQLGLALAELTFTVSKCLRLATLVLIEHSLGGF